MPWFQSTFINKVDKKGRVSVPAPFRASLATRGLSSVALFPAFMGDGYFEGADDTYLTRLTDAVLEQCSPFSDEYQDFTMRILGGRVEAPWDGEGRIVLPDLLVEEAGITDTAVFVGGGESFQVWNQPAWEARRAAARENLRKLGPKLSLRPARNGGEA